MPDATKVPIEPGLLARAGGALRYALTGQSPVAGSFFGPGTPIPPATNADEPRTFDYNAGINLSIRPRSYEPVTFTQLRQLADAYDLLRLCIETRKDQLDKLDWQIVNAADGKPATGADARAMTTLFERPDRRRDWGDWLRMLLEEALVVDAPAISIQRTRGGQLYALRLIKGDTITVKVDDLGEVPEAPGVAYQQIIKGIVFDDFTVDDLFYVPRNQRVGRLYGFSPVEQIVMTVNIALRREVHQLAYYTEAVPDVLIGVPDTWSPEQIAKFQKHWDMLFSQPQGVENARKAKFVPGGMKAELLKKAPLFDEGDEWLARVVTYCFGLPPTPFTKQTNRATAETVQQASLEEGLAPLMSYVARVMNRLLRDYGGATSLRWSWKIAPEVDSLTQAQIDSIYLTQQVQQPEQIAQARGWEYKEPPPAPEPVVVPGPLPPAQEAAKLLKRVRALRGRQY